LWSQMFSQERSLSVSPRKTPSPWVSSCCVQKWWFSALHSVKIFDYCRNERSIKMQCSWVTVLSDRWEQCFIGSMQCKRTKATVALVRLKRILELLQAVLCCADDRCRSQILRSSNVYFALYHIYSGENNIRIL